MNKVITNICMVLLYLCVDAFAGWNGPAIVIEGDWGSADIQFGFQQGDTFAEYPTLDGLFGDGSIVISDTVNKRTLVYGANGVLKEKEDWLAQLAEGGMIRYYHNKYLLGCCVQGYDSNGNLWTGSGDKYALTNKDGVLLSNVSARPLELGQVKKEALGDKKYRFSITYPDRTYVLNLGIPYKKYIRDSAGYVYAVSFKSVKKFNSCGKELGALAIPDDQRNISRPGGGGFEEVSEVLAGYGEPVIAANGDVYTWKRTPDTYSILKWTWVDDPNTPTGPDAPTGLTIMPSTTGLYLTWTASSSDPGCVTGYEVSRATSAGGVSSSIATVAAGVVKYNDTAATAGTTYYYKIRAVSGSEYSPYTSEVSGKR